MDFQNIDVILSEKLYSCEVAIRRPTLNQKRQELMKKLVHQVIQGYERGVPGMCKGETRTLTVPPHLAYGDGGYPGNILHFCFHAI